MAELETTVRDIASGQGWALRLVDCQAKRGEVAFEERHERFVIAAVQQGMFTYHGEHGRKLMSGGAFLLGNAGSCYACGHDHGDGDRCLALQIDAETFEQLSFETLNNAKFRFTNSHLVAPLNLWPIGHNLTQEENVLDFASSVIAATNQSSSAKSITVADEHRICRSLMYLEDHFTETLGLNELSAVAGISRFHFLRIFKAVVGRTPHQHLLSLRLRHAMLLLENTKQPITTIAFEVGFQDLSTFNHAFKSTYKKSPRQARASF